MDEMPQVILGVVVTMIVLAVGVFAFFIVYSEIGYTSDQTQIFGVTNPAVDQVVTLEYSPTGITSVEQFNGVGWFTLAPACYTAYQRTVTISNACLQG